MGCSIRFGVCFFLLCFCSRPVSYGNVFAAGCLCVWYYNVYTSSNSLKICPFNGLVLCAHRTRQELWVKLWNSLSRRCQRRKDSSKQQKVKWENKAQTEANNTKSTIATTIANTVSHSWKTEPVEFPLNSGHRRTSPTSRVRLLWCSCQNS